MESMTTGGSMMYSPNSPSDTGIAGIETLEPETAPYYPPVHIHIRTVLTCFWTAQSEIMTWYQQARITATLVFELTGTKQVLPCASVSDWA